MTLTDAAIAKALSGKHALIVEDDTPLARRIARLLKAKTGIEPIVVGCMEAASRKVAKQPFDLGIVDCMIPRSAKDHRKIQELDRAIREIKNAIRQIDSGTEDPHESEMLARARDARAAALAKIDDLIVPDGGIQIVKEWRCTSGGSPADFPILYLTAISAGEQQKDGQAVAGQPVAWLVKPVSSQEIIRACAMLLGALVSTKKE